MFIGFLVVVVALFVTNIRIVPQAKCVLIERLGQYHTTWDAGIHVKIPFIDRIVSTISLKEQVLDFPPQNVITKDNVTIRIDSVVYAKVFDPKKYTYGVENPVLGLENLTATNLRSVIGEMELDATLSSRAEINAQMQDLLDKATDDWGIKVCRVEIKNITPPKEIEEVMTKQMRAERDRRETLLQAQAHRESVVAQAEGDKTAKIMAAEAERDAAVALAEGKAKAIQMVYDAEAEGLRKLSEAGANEAVLRLKAIEAMKDVADGQATKIFIPNDLASALSSVGVVGDLLGTAGPVKNGIPRKELHQQQIAEQAGKAISRETCYANPEANETTKGALAKNAAVSASMRHKTLNH